MEEKCYQILGCTSSDSLETIKVNYRKLLLKYHPDKNEGESAKFIEIQDAYTHCVKKRALTFDWKAEARRAMIIMALSVRPKDIKLNLSVSIEDVYRGITKRISYRRNSGGGQIKEHVFINLHNFEQQYVFYGLGDQNPITKSCSDLIVNFELDYINHPQCRIDDLFNLHNMSFTLEINLYEYFFGLKHDIPFIEFLDMSYYIPHKHGMTITVPGKGLPYEMNDGTIMRGELFVILRLEFGKVALDDDQFEKAIRKYFLI